MSFDPRLLASESQTVEFKTRFDKPAVEFTVRNLKRQRRLIGWKIASTSSIVASVRYRALLPMLALEKEGVCSRLFSRSSFANLDELDCLVFVKSFKSEDYFLAVEARRRGIPVVLDLCDNIFIKGYGEKYPGLRANHPVQVFMQMAALASTVVVSTDPLANIVRERVPVVSCSVVVIPDGLETAELLCKMMTLLGSVRKLEQVSWPQQLKRQFKLIHDKVAVLRTAELYKFFLPFAHHIIKLTLKDIKRWHAPNRSPKKTVYEPPIKEASERVDGAIRKSQRQHIVWFGHHGAVYAQFGMLDLLAIRGDLESIATNFDVELVVISNSLEKFEEYIKPFGMPTRYVEWSSEALLAELQIADVVVIPNSLDPFSVCKSANRAVLSLLNGVPVVATATPALSPLATCLILDDFKGGLRTYLTDTGSRTRDLSAAKLLIQSFYGLPKIAEKWRTVVDDVVIGVKQTTSPLTLLVVLQNLLDWQVLRSVVEEATSRRISTGAILNSASSAEMVPLSHTLRQWGVEIFPLEPDAASYFEFPPASRAVLCAAESNLLPHRMAHKLLRSANRKGIFTATFQHGYETPGLTYHDSLHSARKIEFAARRIYLWGCINTLRPEVPTRTVNKCLSVGCPEIHATAMASPQNDKADHVLTIGIFENLHWHRYPPAYQLFFLKGVHLLAKRFPAVRFLLRTHPNGRWLTQKEAKSLLTHQNMFLHDATTMAEDMDRLAEVLSSIDAVITTPSTIAVHGARLGLPVAVVSGGLQLDKYAPLTTLKGKGDWPEFVEALFDAEQVNQFSVKSKEFIAKAIFPGNAAARIVDDISSHL